MKFIGKLTTYLTILTTGLVISSTGCKKEENKSSVPVLTTTIVTAQTQNSAKSGGNITSDGGAAITARGICWSTGPMPTIADEKTTDGTGTGIFESTLSNLTIGSTYSVRAYATNSAGTGYGNVISFKCISIPILTTKALSDITSTSARSGGNILADGGSEITARGVCWSTNMTPSISENKTTDGTGSGDFNSLITGLEAGTTYYIRAYATNSAGTGYGEILSLDVLSIPTLTTYDLSVITSNTVNSGGDIIDDGGADVLSRGICWSTHTFPTILDSKTNNGSGTGSFTSKISGLSPSTTYFLRAYATNSIGTGYGSEISFSTTEIVTDIDGNIYHTVKIGDQIWMIENLKVTHFNDGTTIPNITGNSAWQDLTTPAYCWYNNNSSSYKSIYGALYNWFTINTGNLCPTGWHVPTETEWETLSTYAGGVDIAGNILKEVGTSHWIAPNDEATNEVGFTALPGGQRDGFGSFDNIGLNGNYWTSTQLNTSDARYRGMVNNFGLLGRYYTGKYFGFSVRCIKD